VWLARLRLQLSVACRVARIPLKEYTGGIRSRFALSLLFIHWGASTSNVWLLVVHLAFTTANSVHLTTTLPHKQTSKHIWKKKDVSIPSFSLFPFCLLLSLLFCSVYSVFVLPTGTLRLPWLRFYPAFSSVLRQMPGYNSQRRGTGRTLPSWLILVFYVLFVGDRGSTMVNLLTPNANYNGRTAPLTSKVAFYIFIQQI